MAIFDKHLDDVTEQDLQQLVLDSMPELKTLDYKQDVYGANDESKKEFAADVTSFANASGGHIIIGIKELAGEAHEVCGVDLDNPDYELRRLESVIRDTIKPRIPGIMLRDIALTNGKRAIVIRIPASWAAPHAVQYREWMRFYSRNSRGKYILDVGEIRGAFALNDSESNRIKDFRLTRLSKIIADDTPHPMTVGPKVVMHLIPVTAFGNRALSMSVSVLRNGTGEMRPISSIHGYSTRNNFDGALSWTATTDGVKTYAYTQAFRNGVIEAVSARNFIHDRKLIASLAFENDILEAIPVYLKIQNELGIEPPILLMLSIHGVKGYSFALPSNRYWSGITEPVIDRDDLITPEMMIEDFNGNNLPHIVKLAFDMFWNAAGWYGSLCYNEAGERTHR